MKTKIRPLVIIIAFFLTSFAFAGGIPNSSGDHPQSVKPEYPMEIPKPLTLRLDVQITLFLADFFNLTWEPAEVKQEYVDNSQQKN